MTTTVTSGGGEVTKHRSVAAAQSIVVVRRRAGRLLPVGLVSDPAFDMLLDLYLASSAGMGRSVKACTFASGVPSSTAMRWLATLEDAALVERRPDPRDRRKTIVHLTPTGLERTEAWLAGDAPAAPACPLR